MSNVTYPYSIEQMIEAGIYIRWQKLYKELMRFRGLRDTRDFNFTDSNIKNESKQLDCFMFKDFFLAELYCFVFSSILFIIEILYSKLN